jgi:hypothetical protein
VLTAGSIYRNKDHNQRETKEARVSLDSNDQSKEEAGSDLGAGNEDSQAKELEVKSLAVDKVDDQPGNELEKTTVSTACQIHSNCLFVFDENRPTKRRRVLHSICLRLCMLNGHR